MDDLISRQAAIAALGDIHPLDYNAQAYKARIEKLPSAQPTQTNASNALETSDCVSRQAAIDALSMMQGIVAENGVRKGISMAWQQIEDLPSARPTLYGYSIEHLALIATIMQKEHVTPEKALEYFKDIQRMGQMIIDEQQEIIKRTVEKWMI